MEWLSQTLFRCPKQLSHSMPRSKESIPVMWKITINLVTTVCKDVQSLMVHILGYLKRSLIAALLKLYLTHECAKYDFSKQHKGDLRLLSSSKKLKCLLPTGLPDRQLSICGVSLTGLQTGRYSESTCRCLRLATVSLKSL